MSNTNNNQGVLIVDDQLRLVKYSGLYDFALTWYQDEELVKMVDNRYEVYSVEKLAKMYSYLNNAGELYFIELYKDGKWTPIGDVTLCNNGDLPIVISKPYQNYKIGQRVLSCMIERAKALEYKKLEVGIYNFNIKSKMLFKKLGFVEKAKTSVDIRYVLVLEAKENYIIN